MYPINLRGDEALTMDEVSWLSLNWGRWLEDARPLTASLVSLLPRVPRRSALFYAINWELHRRSEEAEVRLLEGLRRHRKIPRASSVPLPAVDNVPHRVDRECDTQPIRLPLKK